MRKVQFIVILSFALIFHIWIWYADNISWSDTVTWSGSISTWDQITCDDNYLIKWNTDVKQWSMEEYHIINQDQDTTKLNYVEFKLYKWEELVETYLGKKYFHEFISPWKTTLVAEIKDDKDCSYTIEKNINIYDKIVTYIWKDNDNFDSISSDNFENHGLLLKKVFIDTEKSIDVRWTNQQEITKIIIENLYYINSSDYIVINTNDFSSIFDVLWKTSNFQELNLSDKKVFITTDLDPNFFKRLLWKYLKRIWLSKIYVFDEWYLINFLSVLSFGWDVTTESYIKYFTLSFEETPKIYIVSYLIDYLIYNGFPTDLIWLFLMISVAALVISIFRQILGFSVFWIFSPLLFAISMSVLWIKFSFILFFITFLATFLTRLFTKKIYLLYSAKLSLLITLYFIVTIIVLGLDVVMWFNIVDLSLFNNTYIIFPIAFLIVVGDKVFREWEESVFSKAWFIWFVEFLIVSMTTFWLITSFHLRYILLSYPELLLIILIINIFVWRFTGLQLLEYFRFMPIIKKHFEEEEE